ncbi:hypothetical protein [Nocardiopsis sp. MG754419]|uniref:hypothetical protein n=1 Tax=Nocardiopsis sp. MG754419 TaxID=2259865 RepID=UPI001BA84385|nr:hypothetical protein [Nocardiopsis sp. MG754419]
MSDTATEDPSEREAPATKGLHGWKAAAAIFGCGSIAAFGVFGVIVGVLSLLINSASSGFSGSEESALTGTQSAQPREELAPGAMNLCDDYLPSISEISINETWNSSHFDEAEDASYEPSQGRMVSGECRFTIAPQYGSTALWDFEFEFDAVIQSADSGRDQAASDNFADKISSVSEEFQSLQNQDSHDWTQDVQSFYGTDESGASQYLVVAQTRSATYEIRFTGDTSGVEAGEVPEFDFERQARDLVNRLDGRLYRVIPA